MFSSPCCVSHKGTWKLLLFIISLLCLPAPCFPFYKGTLFLGNFYSEFGHRDTDSANETRFSEALAQGRHTGAGVVQCLFFLQSHVAVSGSGEEVQDTEPCISHGSLICVPNHKAMESWEQGRRWVGYYSWLCSLPQSLSLAPSKISYIPFLFKLTRGDLQIPWLA